MGIDDFKLNNAMISFTGGGLNCTESIGDTTTDINTAWFYQSYPYYYPMCYEQKKSTIEQAFKIVSKLMEKKIIEKMSLKQFIETVNSVAEIL